MHTVTTPHPPFRSRDGRLEVHQIPAWQDNLVWVVVHRESGEAAVVDGPPEAEAVLATCDRVGARLTAVINTHIHGDHIGINHALAKRGLLDALRVIGPAEGVPGLTEPVGEGDVVYLGDVEGRVLLTEGHMNGHVSFVFDDLLFCGDTLFTGGCGYLFHGPPEKLFDSLMRLAQLDGDTRVCCAHEYTQDNLRFAWSVEPDNEALAQRIRDTWALRADGHSAVPSRLELERATNPFLRPGSPTLIENVRRAFPDRDPSTPAAVFAATRALKDTKRYRELGDDALPLS